MHDATVVRDDQHVEQLICQRQHFAHRQAIAVTISAVFERLTLEQLHHEVGQPVLGDIIVDHPHYPGMIDRIGRVAFVYEALAHGRILSLLAVQQLQRSAALVTVGDEKHRRNAANAEHLVQAPLPAQRGAEPSIHARLEVGQRLLH